MFLIKLVISSYEYLIKYEVSKIRDVLKNKDYFKGILKELFKEELKEVEKVDRRIMIAHAGMQNSSFMLLKSRKIYLAYYFDNKILEFKDEHVKIIKDIILVKN
jgi:CRISPR/Cas system-associated protein Csx1